MKTNTDVFVVFMKKTNQNANSLELLILFDELINVINDDPFLTL